MLHAGHAKVFAEAKELFKHDVFQLVFVHTTASLEYVLQGAKNCRGGGGCSIRTGRRMKNKFKVPTSMGRVMASVFLTSEGILLVES